MNELTRQYKTKTNYTLEDRAPHDGGAVNIALDIGYSSCKGVSESGTFMFPSFAMKIPEGSRSVFGSSEKSDVIFHDHTTGEKWAVGELALKMLKSGDVKEGKDALFGRDRYSSPLFRIIASTGLAIGLYPNTGGRVRLQTGLPPDYMLSDKPKLVSALAGDYDFSLKIGAGEEQLYRFHMDENDIYCMEQPLGTLFALASDRDGHIMPEAEELMKSNILIFDAGYGTLDIFSIQNGRVSPGANSTFDDLGMRTVFEKTVHKIHEQWGMEVSVPFLQNCLEDGRIRIMDRKTRSSRFEDFSSILVQCVEETAQAALERLDANYGGLFETDILVLAGGTSCAWDKIVREHYKDMETLKIVAGNKNTGLPGVFSNVKGYYARLLGAMRASGQK